ncbi:hypothetical protein NEOLEDRAFT_1129618 [Neolentinus lepideus HHB14362 ss-1]|uniref:Uncharacterized protein n=1 Tax=Neolentinus lepideus HHB14362 ss-1 TaxID=1314782 RepID=A0A165UJI4_9AGAM|nr:hypothetical protein NEOLEDRAFT_1129618 [Neolentinus lepideus HHB14362 ss-1]
MHSIAPLAAIILAAASLVAADTCAICPSTIIDNSTTYYFAYNATQDNDVTFCE